MNILWFYLGSRRKHAVHKTGLIRIGKSERRKRTCYDPHHSFGLFWCGSETHSKNGRFLVPGGKATYTVRSGLYSGKKTAGASRKIDW